MASKPSRPAPVSCAAHRQRRHAHRPAPRRETGMKDLDEIKPLPELSDGRLRLRALRPEDKPAVVRGLNDPECGRFLWAPPYPYSESDFDDFLALQETAWPERRDAFWTITSEDDGSVLGAISLGRQRDAPVRRDRLLVRPLGARPRRHDGRRAAGARLGVRRVGARTPRDRGRRGQHRLAAGSPCGGLLPRGCDARLPHGPRPTHRRRPLRHAPGRPAPPAGRAAVPGDLGWPRLTDGRLLVRPFEPDDAPAVQAACDDPDVAHWIFRLPAPYSLEDAEWFISDARRRLVAGESARLAIEAARPASCSAASASATSPTVRRPRSATGSSARRAAGA